jgi:hypothetical protein
MNRISVIDAAEFSALDYKVIAQLDLPCTLISRVFSIHPIKRYIFRVSWLIKLLNTLIVLLIRDSVIDAVEFSALDYKVAA